ncbi:putative Ig domain-containing protein [Spirosoma arcticum]
MKLTALLFFLGSWLGMAAAYAQTTLQQESFETSGEGSRYTSTTFDLRDVPQSSRAQYFLREDNPVQSTAGNQTFGTTAAPCNPTGANGTFFWASEGARGQTVATPDRPSQTVTLNPVTVTGYTALQVKVLMADTRGPGSPLAVPNWESTDFIRVKARFNGSGAFVTIGQFVGDNVTTGQAMGNLRQDLNLNGASSDNTSAPIVGFAMQDFTFNVTGSGTTLEVMVEVDQIGGTEEFAFDNIRVVGTASATAPPVLAAIEPTNLTYTEGQASPIIISSALTVSDTDSPNLSGATVSISTGFVSGQDQLLFTNQNGITGSGSGTGAITLSGLASKAAYQAALRSVQYQNIELVNATGGTRLVTFLVSDGTNTSNTQSRSIDFIALLNAPAALPYTEDFETNGEGTRYASNSFALAAPCFAFARVTTNQYACSPTTFGNVSGTGYWYGEGTSSLSNPSAVDIGTLVLAPVNTNNYGNLHFNVRLGVGTGDAPPVVLQWEIDDYVKFFYRVNGGSWVQFGAFFGDGPANNNSGNIRRDADLNGVADPTGTLLTTTLQNIDFTLPASVTGAAVDFMIEVNNDGQEELVFDRIVVTGTAFPTVTTAAASNITTTSAVLGGNVTADGGGTLTERGVVYVVGAGIPTTGDTKALVATSGIVVGTAFSGTVSGLTPATTYSVRAYAINSAGTSYGSVVSFTTPAALNVSGVITNVACFGGSNGAINLTPSGGTAPYSFSWGGGVTTEDRTGLTASTYSVTITDATSTSITRSFTVTQPSGVAVTPASQTNIACFGGATGAASINLPTGGVGGYTYDWTPGTPTGDGTRSVSGLSAGTYTVTVTDANGCTASRSATISQPASALNGTTVVTNVSCFSGSNGAINLTPSGGTSPYTFSWGSGITTEDRTGLAAGTYTVTITDANGCTASRTYTVTQPSALTASTSQTNVTTNGGNDGSATISVSGGTSGYTYSWSPNVSTMATASNLNAGTYTVTVTDANGCTLARTFTITQPAATVATAAPVVTAPTNNSRTLDPNITFTGTAPANSQVLLYVAQGGTAVSGSPFSVTAQADGSFSFGPAALPDGVFTVYATAQAAGSSVSANSNTNTFTVDTTRPTVVLTSSSGASGSTNVAAPFAFTATFSEGVSGFVAGDLSVTNGTVSGFIGASGSSVYTFNVTPNTPGTVTSVFVFNNSNQDLAGNFNTASNTYLLTSAPVIAVSPTTVPSGTAAAAYSQTLTASGGTAPYTFAVTSGALPAGLTLTSGGVLAGTPTASGTFNFTVTATDASTGAGPYSGSRAYSLTIGSQPSTAGPVITTPANNSFTNTDVTISGTAPANSALVLYLSQNGSALPPQSFTATADGTFSAGSLPLPEGTYQVYATAQSSGASVSANSATITFTVDQTRPSVAISSTAGATGGSTATSPIPFMVTFSEAVTGFVAGDLTVSNGTVSGLSGSGTTYTFTVTPMANGAVTVDVPTNVAQDAAGNANTAAPQFAITYTPTSTIMGFGASPSSVCVGSPVTFTATVANLSGSYSFTVGNGSNAVVGTSSNAAFSQMLSAVGSGPQNFTLTVNASDGQLTTAVTSVTVNALPVAGLSNNGPLSCTTTSVTLTASGGGTYRFSSGGTQFEDSNTASVSTAGLYSVTVTSATGCTATASTTVTGDQSAPMVSLTNNGPLSCTMSTVTLIANGGSIYQFSLGATQVNGGNTATVNTEGTYSVTVTNGNGCSATASTTVVGDQSVPTASLTNNGPISCSTTTVTLTASGGSTYRFSAGATQIGSGNTATVSSAGIYSVTVVATNGCSAMASTTVEGDVNVPTASLTNNGPISCSMPSATLTASGGSTYQFSSGASQIGNGSTATVSTAGVYSVTVTSTNGCSAVAQTTVSQDNTAPLATLSATPSTTLSCAQTSVTLTAGGGQRYAFSGPGLVSQDPTSGTAVANAAGVYSVTVTSAGGCTATQTTSLETNNTLAAPDFFTQYGQPYQGGVQRVTVGQNTGTVTFQFSNCIGGTVNWSGQDGSSGTGNIVAMTSQPGTLTYTGTCTLNSCVSPASSVSVTTTAANTPPVATANANQTATVGTAFSYTVNAFTDSETPNGLTYSASIVPANGLVFDPATRIISGTPSTSGVSSVTVMATDPGSLSASTTFTITVSPAPVVVTPLALTLTANPIMILTTGSTSLSATVSGGTTPYSYVFSGPGTITPSGNTASVSGLSAGVQTFTVLVTDATSPTSQTSTGTVSVTVSEPAPTNTPPTTTGIANQTATVNQAFSLNVASSFSDAETPNTLSYSATGLPAGLSLSGSTISGTPSMSGVSSVTVTATDPGSLSVSTSFTFTVSPASMTSTAPFAITGVTTLDCTPVANRINVNFNPRYAGLNGQPISFQVVNELSPTTAPGPYSLSLYADNPVILLKATQSGTTGEATFSYNWLAACNSLSMVTPNNTPPTTTGIANQSGTVNQGFSLNVASSFSDAETPNNLSYSATGLPAGLSLSGSTISGTPSASGVSTVTVRATDPGSLSVATSFTFTVSPAASMTSTAPFAITGVTTLDCTPVANRINVNFNPRYAGLNGQNISFQVVNELSPTTAPGPYSLSLYADNPVILLKATQSGTAGEASFSYNWLAACNSLSMVTPNNTPPTTTGIANQSGTVNQGFSLNVASSFSDAETPNNLSYSATGLPAGLSLSGSTISGTPSASGVSTVTVRATDPGSLSVATSFSFTVSPAASMTSTAPFAITGVTTLSCQPVGNQINLTFNPQYAGANGQPISFSVVNELSPTTAPGPYTLRLYTDNPTITLKATQQGTAGEVSFAYNWLAACTNGSGARLGAEPVSELQVRVLGNPVVGEMVDVEVRGGAGQSLRVQVVSEQGYRIDEQGVEQAGSVERFTLRVGPSAGVYLLRVSSSLQSQTLKLLKK